MKTYAKAIYDATIYAECTDVDPNDPIDAAVDLFRMCSAAGAKVIFAGNGGSLSACTHMANDLCLAGVSAIALDSAVNMACIANDFNFIEVFSRQLKWFATKDDVVVLLSCSGQSSNILVAAEMAKLRGCRLITLSGFKPDNSLRKLGDMNFYVPSNSYGVVQLAQEAILHCVIDRIAKEK